MGYSILDNKTSDKDVKSKKERKTISFYPIEPEWSLDDIILSKELRNTLEDVVSFCLNKPRIVEEWGLHRFLKGAGGCTAINFWGLPGTGKSIAAEAIAKAMGKRVVQVSYSSLMDSLQGNTEKNITALFETAVEEDCVILFDEADGLLSARKSNSSNSDSVNLIKSHMLNLLDRSSATVIFTTNFFKSYDRAFVRRILWNIEFRTPGLDEITQLWNFHIGEKIPREITFEDLSSLTYELGCQSDVKITGGDIKKITLMFCTQLTSGRCKSITKSVAEVVIKRYLDDLQENTHKESRENIVENSQLSHSVNKALNK